MLPRCDLVQNIWTLLVRHGLQPQLFSTSSTSCPIFNLNRRNVPTSASFIWVKTCPTAFSTWIKYMMLWLISLKKRICIGYEGGKNSTLPNSKHLFMQCKSALSNKIFALRPLSRPRMQKMYTLKRSSEFVQFDRVILDRLIKDIYHDNSTQILYIFFQNRILVLNCQPFLRKKNPRLFFAMHRE